jgi:hypothetical protein
MVKQTSKLSDQTSEPSEHNTRLICPIRVTRPSRAYRQPPVPQPAPDKPPLTPRPARRLLLGPAALIAALDPAAHLPRCTLSHTHKHARARTIQQRTCRDVPPLTHSLTLSHTHTLIHARSAAHLPRCRVTSCACALHRIPVSGPGPARGHHVPLSGPRVKPTPSHGQVQRVRSTGPPVPVSAAGPIRLRQAPVVYRERRAARARGRGVQAGGGLWRACAGRGGP